MKNKLEFLITALLVCICIVLTWTNYRNDQRLTAIEEQFSEASKDEAIPLYSQRSPAPTRYTRKQEKDCIVEALYYESRGEGIKGITAVASVIANRRNSKIYPNSYCSVVNQSKQFSFTDEGKPLGRALEASVGLPDKEAYDYISTTADRMLKGTFKPSLGASVMWYHADSVKPTWSRVKSKVRKIGKHIFYKSKIEGKK